MDHRERQVAPHSLAFNVTADKYALPSFILPDKCIIDLCCFRLYCGFDSSIEIFDVHRPGEGTRLLTSPSKKSRDGMKGAFPAHEIPVHLNWLFCFLFVSWLVLVPV